MKAGFVNIFGRPNAGKSTLLNALMGEKLAIVSPKVQTTRHRIKGIYSTENYQIIFSDTPGIVEPKYKLHEKMMQAVKTALEDADLALLLIDVRDNVDEIDQLFASLRLKVPSFIVINKIDTVSAEKLDLTVQFFKEKSYAGDVIGVSALTGASLNMLLEKIVAILPEAQPFYSGEDLSDLPTKFFVAEMIREKIYYLFEEEIPYHATVTVTEFKEKSTLIKIRAEIVVQRESQKAIILGEGGKMIKKLGSEARIDIENFLSQKVFLELFVKVRPKWRENDLLLKEYGY